MPLHVVGISALYHDAACCLLRDGELVAAASEERFSRVKGDPRLPVSAFRSCLEAGGLAIGELDAVAFYERPIAKLARQLWSRWPELSGGAEWLDPGRVERQVRERLGWDGPLLFQGHHESHAASGFCFSGFDEAAVLTVDGVGEWATTTLGRGAGDQLEILRTVDFPHSLGLFYAAVTAFLGFRVNDGEYKVMGLAAYGRPRFVEELREVVPRREDGGYTLRPEPFDFVRGPRMYAPEWWRTRLGIEPRAPGDPLLEAHRDLAKSAQVVLEERLLDLARELWEITRSPRACLAGGVALNCVANARLRREGPFEEIFVQPAAGDAGGALGAAALATAELAGRLPRRRLEHAFWGPRCEVAEVARLLGALGLPARDFRGCEQDLCDEVAARLDRREIVGWVHGPMELGPRALGARSILANPLDPEARGRLNRAIKKREEFRPFAPSVLAEHAAEHFALDHPSPFMLETCRVTSPLELPGITHVDGTARPQTVDAREAPRFARMIESFRRRTGCPLVVNTSFNQSGEPIVRSAVDALLCFGRAGLDCLVLEDFLLERSAMPPAWDRLLPVWGADARARRGADHELDESLYTFV